MLIVSLLNVKVPRLSQNRVTVAFPVHIREAWIYEAPDFVSRFWTDGPGSAFEHSNRLWRILHTRSNSVVSTMPSTKDKYTEWTVSVENV